MESWVARPGFLGRPSEHSRIVSLQKEASVPSPKTAFETLDAGEWVSGSESGDSAAVAAPETAKGPAVGAHAPRPRRPACPRAGHMLSLQTQTGPLTGGRGLTPAPPPGCLGVPGVDGG